MVGFDGISEWLSGIDSEPTQAAGQLGRNPETISDSRPAKGQLPAQRTTTTPNEPAAVQNRISSEKYSAKVLSLSPLESPPPSSKRPEAGPSHQVNKYERKPRRRIRPDRYEYKELSRRDVKGTGIQRRELSKLRRRHLFNDDFHASNVARSRLTLQFPLNAGIFQKGRTSSPVRSRNLETLAFSEMKFLSKAPQLNGGNLLAHRTVEADRAKEQREQRHIQDYEIRFRKPSASTSSPVKGNSTLSGHDGLHSCKGSSLSGCQLPLESQHQFATRNIPCGNPFRDDNKPGTNKKSPEKQTGTRSYYTWSESCRCSSDDLYRDCLNRIFPVSPTRQISRPMAMLEAGETYLDVETLKYILEDRKRLWDSIGRLSPARSLKRKLCKSSEPGGGSYPEQSKGARKRVTQEALALYEKEKRKETTPSRDCPLSQPTVYEAALRASSPTCHSPPFRLQWVENEQQSTGPSISLSPWYPNTSHGRRSSKCIAPGFPSQHLKLPAIQYSELSKESQSANPFDLSCSHKEVTQLGENDTLFIQALDAAYDKILDGETRGRVKWTDILSQNHGASVACQDNEIRGILTAARPVVFSDNVDKLLSTHPKPYDFVIEANDSNRFVPQIVSGYEGSLHKTSQSLPRTPERSNEHTGSGTRPCIEITGFWLQNKLY